MSVLAVEIDTEGFATTARPGAELKRGRRNWLYSFIKWQITRHQPVRPHLNEPQPTDVTGVLGARAPNTALHTRPRV